MKHHTYQSHFVDFIDGVSGVRSNDKEVFLRDTFEAVRHLTNVDRGAIIITKNCKLDPNHIPVNFVDLTASCGPRPLRRDDV